MQTLTNDKHIASGHYEFLLAGIYFFYWLFPVFYEYQILKSLVFLILLEFFIIHSSFFLVGRQLKNRQEKLFTGGVLAFYAMLIGGIGFMANDFLLPVVFLILSYNRIKTIPRSWKNDIDQTVFVARWMLTTMIYIIIVVLVFTIPLPALGLTPEVVAAQDYGSNATGEFIEQPQVAMATGFLYFLSQGLMLRRQDRIRAWLEMKQAEQKSKKWK